MQQYLTGLFSLDSLLGGLYSSRLYVFGARPGMGLTALSLTILHNQVQDLCIPCAYFSSQMNESDLLYCLQLMYGDVLTETTPIYIRTAVQDEQTLYDEIYRLAAFGVKIIYIDSLQYIVTNNPSLKRDASMILALKKLAITLDVVIVALTGINYQCDLRGGSKRAHLMDLKGSKIIEDIADIIGFLYRPEYYGYIVLVR